MDLQHVITVLQHEHAAPLTGRTLVRGDRPGTFQIGSLVADNSLYGEWQINKAVMNTAQLLTEATKRASHSNRMIRTFFRLVRDHADDLTMQGGVDIMLELWSQPAPKKEPEQATATQKEGPTSATT